VAGQTRIQEPRGTASMRPGVARGGGVAQMVPVVPGGPTTWVVGPGDSFWSIAEELLADAWGRPPTDAETDPVWRGLVERNRGRLVDPGDPDAIHPGQVFEVPPLPPVA
jgi:nucleoid-associated protein YgaU